MSAKSYAESAKSSSAASSSAALTPSSAASQYPPIIPNPTPSSQSVRAKSSELANKALAVVAANTPSNGNVWATRIQNSQMQQQQTQRTSDKEREKLKDKEEEDYDPFVVRRFNHPPVRISVNGTGSHVEQESWPAIGGKPSQDKEKERVKWPPSKQPTPPQSNILNSSSQSTSNNPPSAAPAAKHHPNPSPSVPPQAPVPSPPSTNMQSGQKQKYTFGTIDTQIPSRTKQQAQAAQSHTQESWKMTTQKKKGGKKEGKGKEEVKVNGGGSQVGEEPPAASAERPTPSPSLRMPGLTPSVTMGKKSISREKSKEKLPASTKGILVGGGEEEENIVENQGAKWRFMVDAEEEGSLKGSRTPIPSGSLSPLVMDPHLTALKSTQNSTPSLSPVVLAQAIGAIALESNATPPGISPIPSPLPTHPDNGLTSQPQQQDERESSSVTASDVFEVRDFGYGFGGMDPEVIRRSHEERLADMERSQYERQRALDIPEPYSPNRYPAPELADPVGPRGYRRGYASRGYHEGRGGRRGMGMGGGRGGSRGLRYPRPSSMHLSHSPISPTNSHLELNNPYPYPPPAPPYGYPMPFYPPPPGAYDYGTYYPYPPPSHSPASYSPSQYHPPPPQFDMGFPPPSTPVDQPQPFPVPITRVPFQLDHTRYYLLGQLEYYLSPDNLVHDFYLRQKMDSLGYIPISLIASFNRVKHLTPSVEMVKEVLLLSSVAEVKDDFVRMVGWQQWILPDASPSIVETSHPTDAGSGEGDDEDEEVVFVMESTEASNSNDNGQTIGN